MNAVDVGRHAKLQRVIVDKYVRIPPGIEIGYNPEEDRRRFTVRNPGSSSFPGMLASGIRMYPEEGEFNPWQIVQKLLCP